MKKDDTPAAVISCLLLIISMPIGALWSGYVLSVLWAWFIVPTFEARPLAVLPAIGVAIVVGYLTKQIDRYTDTNKSAAERIAESIGYIFLSPAFALAFGWIVHSFM